MAISHAPNVSFYTESSAQVDGANDRLGAPAKLVGKRLPRRTKITVRAGSGFVTGTATIVAVGAATVHVCVAGVGSTLPA